VSGAPSAVGPNAAGVHWDLSRIVADPETAVAQMDEALTRARAFAERYRGRLGEMDGAELAEALRELGGLEDDLSRIASYAHLREAVDVSDTATRDLSAKMDRAMVEAANALRFFELEWNALPEEVAERLADAPEVAADRHHLKAQRRFAPHLREENEERMLAERSPAAASAWQTLFGRITSTLEVEFDAGEGPAPHTIDRLLAHVRDPRRDVRRGAMEALYAGLEPHADTLAHCYDTLVADRLAMDAIRGYDGPMQPTHLRNELSAEIVDPMLDAVSGGYGLAQRWFRHKAELLGLPVLALWDQYAPVGEARSVGYAEACAIVDAAFGRFSPRISAVSDAFFAESRIDAEPRSGKRGGAFCAPISSDVPPFVLLNFTDRMDDVMTMAHELGHGMHFALSAERQTPLSSHTGIALAEVPSTFAELLAFDHLMANEADADTRRALVSERVEGSFATVFRQTVLTRYEQRAYALRAEGSTLTAERLGDIWFEENARYYGDAVEMPDGYRLGWAYIPHFISTRFYTYAYVFAHLVTLALHAGYKERGEDFVAPYVDFLAAGGSAAPADLLGALGLDLESGGVWQTGLGEMARMVELAGAPA
jgi:oligoendopeptidase F